MFQVYAHENWEHNKFGSALELGKYGICIDFIMCFVRAVFTSNSIFIQKKKEKWLIDWLLIAVAAFWMEESPEMPM